jgi:hypothetical protein
MRENLQRKEGEETARDQAKERERFFASEVHVWLREPATFYQAMERNLNLIFIADRLRGTVTATRMMLQLYMVHEDGQSGHNTDR